MKKNFFTRISCLALSLFLCTEVIQAQSRFRATVIGGVNLSQIDGDLQQGYRKKNLSVGLSCAAVFKPDLDVSAELFYNPRGARPSPEGSPQSSKLFATMNFQYADAVMLFNFHSFPHKTKDFYRQTLKLGFSYGRLLKSGIDIKYNGRVAQTEYEQELLKGLKKDDISLVVGAAWQFNPRWGVMLRHTSSLRRIYERIGASSTAQIPNSEKDFRFLSPYFFSIQTFYHFVSPHKTLGVRRNKKNGGGDPLEEL
jgi:Outer membrane protein beta-barrel domain